MLKKLKMANTPTPIEKIQLVDADLPANLYVKRDDLTGVGLTGNKVRKLEYLMQKALDEGVTDIVTCGSIQSNHCRATSLACAKLGLKANLLLAGDENEPKESNNFLDYVAGATQRYITRYDFDHNRTELMEEWAKEIEAKEGHKTTIWPEGASCAVGSFGYVDCYEEILEQEEKMGVEFDTIVVTTGSAGSFAGLIYANKKYGKDKDIVGITISYPAQRTINELVPPILEEMKEYDETDLEFTTDDIHVIDGYQGLGYAKNTMEELEFMRDFISQTGIIIDPVYTGKTMYAIFNELMNGNWADKKNVLFLHTGGAFGWTREKIDQLQGK